MKNPLSPGDVIRTHPKRGFWGCAVVLTAQDSTTEFHPSCHIATLDFISKRKYAWKNIDVEGCEIVSRNYEVRVSPNVYKKAPIPKLAIGIYTLKKADNLDLIGKTYPSKIYAEPLTFNVGNGTSGLFPLCGPISDKLGWEAVVLWRKINDAERLEKDTFNSRKRFEKFEKNRLEEQRENRRLRAL